MQTFALVWGILAVLGMVVAFTPCLGSLNWLNIPFAGFGAIFSLAALLRAKPGHRRLATIALALCLAAVVFGMARLKLGAGIL